MLVTHYGKKDSDKHLADGTIYGEHGYNFCAMPGRKYLKKEVWVKWDKKWIGPISVRDVSARSIDLSSRCCLSRFGRRFYDIGKISCQYTFINPNKQMRKHKKD